jgi:hypothetical protein
MVERGQRLGGRSPDLGTAIAECGHRHLDDRQLSLGVGPGSASLSEPNSGQNRTVVAAAVQPRHLDSIRERPAGHIVSFS